MLVDFDAEYPGLDDPQRFIRLLSPVVERAAACGMDLVVAPVSQVTLDDRKRLVAGGGPVDGVFRLFVPNRVTPSAGVTHWRRGWRRARCRCGCRRRRGWSPTSAAFAWLWEDADTLPAADRDLVHRYVPRTWSLTAELLDRRWPTGMTWWRSRPTAPPGWTC